ncbi:MAG: hypothetical protein GY722_15410 [bacterium]|nr:hypothetical protein [bacterium]
MNREQQAAYILSQIACANIEMESMKARNREDEANCKPPTNSSDAFYDLIEKYGIHHNAVVGFFRD